MNCCDRHRQEYADAERAFADYCFEVAELVPGVRVESKNQSADQGRRELQKATLVNNELERPLNEWLCQVQSWSQVGSSAPVFPTIQQGRPDLTMLNGDNSLKEDLQKTVQERADQLRESFLASVDVVKALQLHRAKQELMNSFSQRDGARHLNAIHLALEIGLCNEDIPCVFQVSRRVPIDVPNVENDDKKSKLASEQLNHEDTCIQYVLEPFPCQRPMIRKSMGLAVQHEVVIEETGGKDGKRLVIGCWLCLCTR